MTTNMERMRNIVWVVLASLVMVSCFNKEQPNYQFMPNMYEPVGYETYGEYQIFPNEQAAMLPAEGSIPRGWQPYEYPNTNEGLELAKVELQNPIPVTEENLTAGKELYDIYCALCHGEKGDGQGILMEREKILGVPSYDAEGRVITPGGTYHVMMFGLNTMGSYASQTNELERWQIVHHVMNLKATLEGTPLLTPVTEAEAEDMDTEAENGEGDSDDGHGGEEENSEEH